MKRNLFVQKVGFGLGALLLLPGVEVFSKPSNNIKIAQLSLAANGKKEKTVKIYGQILDTNTQESISAKISIWKKGLHSPTKVSQYNATDFVIENELGSNFSENLFFKISAQGYKTCEATLSVSKVAVCIDASIWQYNPNFSTAHRPDNHREILDELHVDFNFHLLPLKL